MALTKNVLRSYDYVGKLLIGQSFLSSQNIKKIMLAFLSLRLQRLQDLFETSDLDVLIRLLLDAFSRHLWVHLQLFSVKLSCRNIWIRQLEEVRRCLKDVLCPLGGRKQNFSLINSIYPVFLLLEMQRRLRPKCTTCFLLGLKRND